MSNAEDLKQQFAIAPEMLERLVSKPRAARKSQHFVRVPMAWVSRLSGTSGHTYQVALQLLYLNWRDRGKPIKLEIACSALMVSAASRSGGRYEISSAGG